jgi:hypothetical protein
VIGTVGRHSAEPENEANMAEIETKPVVAVMGI